MLIREATAEKLPVVMEFIRELDPQTPEHPGAALDTFQEMKQYPFYRCYLMETEDGTPIGTFSLLICCNLGHGSKKFAIVENVVISNAFRGQGFGKTMMEFSMQTARDYGCYKLMLSSSAARTEAHRFYDSLGFERHGISFRTEV